MSVARFRRPAASPARRLVFLAIAAAFATSAAADPASPEPAATRLDGVEVNAGQHSLVRQFLSGLTNPRGHEWAARNRFPTHVPAAAPARLGADAAPGMRLSCDDHAP